MSAVRRTARALVAVAALATIAGCGDPGPLDSLSDAQQDQLAAAWTARINATDAAAIPLDERNARVKTLYTSCAGLDRSSPLLAALSDSCQPVAIGTKLEAVLPERCAKPSTPCVRALDRIAQTTEQIATATSALSAAAKTAIADPSCQAEFAANETQLKAYGDLAEAYRVLALGVERRDEDISALGQRRIDDARALITPKGRVDERLLRFRKACGLGD